MGYSSANRNTFCRRNKKIKMKQLSEAELQQHFNRETGQLAWNELQPHFERDSVIIVHPNLDLIDVATKLVMDNKIVIEGYLKNGNIARASTQDAQRWRALQTSFWTVVTAPWVLVQEIIDNK